MKRFEIWLGAWKKTINTLTSFSVVGLPLHLLARENLMELQNIIGEAVEVDEERLYLKKLDARRVKMKSFEAYLLYEPILIRMG